MNINSPVYRTRMIPVYASTFTCEQQFCCKFVVSTLYSADLQTGSFGLSKNFNMLPCLCVQN